MSAKQRRVKNNKRTGRRGGGGGGGGGGKGEGRRVCCTRLKDANKALEFYGHPLFGKNDGRETRIGCCYKL